MVENLPQFTAMVMAADYGWSGRQEPLDKLGYDPAEVFRQMYFAAPSPTAPIRGTAWTWGTTGTPMQIGTTKYTRQSPVSLRTVLTSDGAHAPNRIVLSGLAVGGHVGLALSTAKALPDGTPMGEVVIEGSHGERVIRQLVYGHHVRCAEDRSVVPYAARNEGICSLEYDLLKPMTIKSVSIREENDAAGIKLFGLTVW